MLYLWNSFYISPSITYKAAKWRFEFPSKSVSYCNDISQFSFPQVKFPLSGNSWQYKAFALIICPESWIFQLWVPFYGSNDFRQPNPCPLAHRGLVIYVSDQGNSLLSIPWEASSWTNTELFGPLRTKFSEVFIKIQQVSFWKMHLRRLSAIFCSQWAASYENGSIGNPMVEIRWSPDHLAHLHIGTSYSG